MPFDYLEGHFLISQTMKKLLLLTITPFLFFFANSQTYKNPIASKQSHPELKITRIEITENNTIVSLEVTNKRTVGGWFCANSDIFLKNSKRTETYQLIKSENIPTCPDQYEFSSVGETLAFKLYFPSIDQDIKFIDLVENCTNACFSFYRIILDNQHNQKIRAFEKGFDLYQENNLKESATYFEEVTQGKSSIDSHIYGLSHYYLILIYHELDDTSKVEFWYKNLINSDFKDKNTFVKELDKLGIKK